MRQALASVILLLGVALGQNAPGTAAPGSAPPSQVTGAILGAWQTAVPLGQGMPPATGIFIARPDNTYREELHVQGQLAAFWEGTYTLTPDGVLTQDETSKSPQICAMGECYPNDGSARTVSRVRVQGPNAILVSSQDPASGQTVTLAWQRKASQAPPPGQASARPPSAAPPAAPVPGRAVAGTPAPAAAAVPWGGTYTDGDLTLRLGGEQGNRLERAGESYPLNLRANGGRLQGTFLAGGNSFPVVIERAGEDLVVTTGGARYELAPEPAQGPAQPANPLGNGN